MSVSGSKPPWASVSRLISSSGISIYDPLAQDDERFLSATALEALLRERLRGLSLNYPIRTRAKVAKTAVCRALGYPVPAGFRKSRPRFPGQNLDLYVQKSDNLQIWNEEVAPDRRYALIRVNSADRVVDVKILTGEALAKLDHTGTLTSKYQARLRNQGVAEREAAYLVSANDTELFRRVLRPSDDIAQEVLQTLSPTDPPARGSTLTIRGLLDRLRTLLGKSFPDPGLDQERNRGAELHRMVCARLGLRGYQDEGQFPDVPCQALEVKLQTSPTIDLGLVSPDSKEPAEGLGGQLRHSDMRYAVFYAAKPSADLVRLDRLVVTNGEHFFTKFVRFGGLIQNRKIQIPLPPTLFKESE